MIKLEGFNHLAIQYGVCGNRPTLIGTRLEPFHIYNFGTDDEIKLNFGLSDDQLRECFKYVEIMEGMKS